MVHIRKYLPLILVTVKFIIVIVIEANGLTHLLDNLTFFSSTFLRLLAVIFLEFFSPRCFGSCCRFVCKLVTID